MKIYHGNFVCAKDKDSFVSYENSYITVDDGGIITDISSVKPDGEITDLGDGIVIPAFSDLHLHSAQQQGAGLGYDDYKNWFPSTTLPNEAKYTADREFAHRTNSKLIWRLWKNGIMNSVIMSTENLAATEDLILQMSQTGMSSYIGKMNSDYGYFGDARETTETSISDTDYLMEKYGKGVGNTHLILSPEFAPACTDEIMEYLGRKAEENGLCIHSHLAESGSDVKAVKERFGENYSHVYKKFGLLGDVPTVMAHCMNIDDDEIPLLADENVIAVHCPMSNLDVPGVTLMNVRKLLDSGVKIAFGSDVGGGHTFSIPKNLVCAAQTAKQLHKRIPQQTVTMNELYYCATVTGGSFFGKSGKFEKGYFFDALAVDDKVMREDGEFSLADRLLRYIYCADECEIIRRYCRGRLIDEPEYEPING